MEENSERTKIEIIKKIEITGNQKSTSKESEYSRTKPPRQKPK